MAEPNKTDKAKRKAFSIKEKVALIEESMQPGYSQVQAAKKHDIKQSTLACILRDKAKILAVADAGQKSKRVVKGKEHELEEKLFEWFLKVRGQGQPIDDPIVRRQAEKLSKDMNLDTNLTFSAGWLFKWRSRFGIEFKKQHGEQQSADFDSAKKWIKETLPLLLASYKPEDVFNADETGLFYRGMSTRSFVLASEKPKGVKMAKERLTVLVCTNMDGSEKPRLLVIGKSARPRKFPKKLDSLPVDYEWSKKAWMNSTIWDKALRKWDRKLRLKNRKILLLVDNAPSHSVLANLTHIRVEFLPKNTTSLIQPCDAGIIKNLKGFYRAELSDRILALLETNKTATAADLVKKVSVLDAIHMLARAWRSVKPSTIHNCFKKAFSTRAEEDEEAEDDQPTFDCLTDVPVPRDLTREEFEDLVDRDVAAGAIEPDEEDENEDEGEGESDEEGEVAEKVTTQECLESLEKVRSYCQQRDFGESIHQSLKMIENNCLVESHTQLVKQKRVTDFFSQK